MRLAAAILAGTEQNRTEHFHHCNEFRVTSILLEGSITAWALVTLGAG